MDSPYDDDIDDDIDIDYDIDCCSSVLDNVHDSLLFKRLVSMHFWINISRTFDSTPKVL